MITFTLVFLLFSIPAISFTLKSGNQVVTLLVGSLLFFFIVAFASNGFKIDSYLFKDDKSISNVFDIAEQKCSEIK